MNSFRIDSYLNEEVLLREKDRLAPRVLREECSVISATQNYATIAFRGAHFEQGVSFLSSLQLSDAEEAFFLANVGRDSRLLLDTPHGSCLVFADSLSETGLLCALLLPKAEPSSVAAALVQLSSLPFLSRVTPSSHRAPAAQDSALCRELLFYMERILSERSADASLLWRDSLLVANFVGCIVEKASFPPTESRLSHSDICRLRLFLLCSFLTLRGTGGGVCADGEDSDGRLLLRVEQKKQYTPLHKRKKASDREAFFGQFSFLKEPAFSDFWVSVPEVGIVFNGKLPLLERTGHLRSRSACELYFCLKIIPME